MALNQGILYIIFRELHKFLGFLLQMGALMIVFGGEQNEPRNETWSFNFGMHTFLAYKFVFIENSPFLCSYCHFIYIVHLL